MKYIWTVLAFFICLFLAWVGGFDFDKRGIDTFFICLFTIFITGFVYSFVSIHDEYNKETKKH